MSTITKDDVQHIATLARLQLTDEEQEQMTKDLGSILDNFAKLANVDTHDVDPTAQVTGIENAYRDDADPHAPGAWTDKLLEQAPDTKGKHVKVKGTLKQ